MKPMMRELPRHLLVALTIALVVALTTPSSANAERRWDYSEKPYDSMSLPEKAGSNLRRGVLDLVDSVMQAGLSGMRILSPHGGFLAAKVGTVAGDVVGLVDNNVVTQHLFQGILSRQLLRFGTRARAMPKGLGVIHDTEFEAPHLPLDDYIGDRTFHTKAYGQPSGLAALSAVVVSDLLMRPVGSLITIFGARSTGNSIHEYGRDLIERSFKLRFL
jgi:hypothetical protein